jgi:hypothetical protein
MPQADMVKVTFRCSRELADVLNRLACRHPHGLRGLIATWAGHAGFTDAAERDLARPDGRRRQPVPQASPEAVERLAGQAG